MEADHGPRAPPAGLRAPGLAPEQRLEHLRQAGLGEDQLAEDLETLTEVGRWLAKSGLRAGERALRATLAATTWVAVRILHAGQAGASSLASRVNTRARR